MARCADLGGCSLEGPVNVLQLNKVALVPHLVLHPPNHLWTVKLSGMILDTEQVMAHTVSI